MWEKYSSEIGKKDGPLRHVDENCQEYPHLNGFVAFDMETWWAERSISCMINDNSKISNEIITTPTVNNDKKSNENSITKSFNFNLATQFNMQKSLQNSKFCLC